MASNTYDITIKQGSTYTLEMQIDDSLGAGIDLTGHTFRGVIKKLISSTTNEASFSFVIDPDQVTNAGKVTATISAVNTALIDAHKTENCRRRTTCMSYDIESIDSSDNVERWLEGVANISPEVTR